MHKLTLCFLFFLYTNKKYNSSCHIFSTDHPHTGEKLQSTRKHTLFSRILLLYQFCVKVHGRIDQVVSGLCQVCFLRTCKFTQYSLMQVALFSELHFGRVVALKDYFYSNISSKLAILFI